MPYLGPIPSVVYVVATRLQQLESGAEVSADVLPRAHVQLRSGLWLAVQASGLTTSSGKRQVAVIVEPAGPSEIAPLIVSAYALTHRETEIAQRVLQGLSTKEIASTLSIPTLTVQQHLKLIVDQVGVRSRRELVSQVFDQHYMPRIKAGASIRANGWFVEPGAALN
jgi:DNA-binding NarL/FixJ family response regulator